MDNSNKKKAEQLGMPHGTAQHRLRKSILFALIQRSGVDSCHRCGSVIKSIEELSIEHIEPWLDSENPVEMFFDLNNIAFSHLKCNIKAARQPRKGKLKHPSLSAYIQGCRCSGCKELQRLKMGVYRKSKL